MASAPPALMVDYSYARVTAAEIHAAGYCGAMRYLSTDKDKNLGKAEAAALLAEGLSIALVWETTAARALEGPAAGVADTHQAEAQARALGYPGSCVIFYAVDVDANPALVAPYFAGAKSVATFSLGIYGSARIVEAISDAPWKWQSAAWSLGRVSPQAHLYQRLGITVAHPILGTDENVICRPFPAWSAITPVHPPVPPVKPPVDSGGITVQTINLSAAGVTITGRGVAPMQRLLAVNPDGQAGPITRARLASEQVRIFGHADYAFGPLTASALLAGR